MRERGHHHRQRNRQPGENSGSESMGILASKHGLILRCLRRKATRLIPSDKPVQSNHTVQRYEIIDEPSLVNRGLIGEPYTSTICP
jgi:hypothetical protein